MQSVIVRSNSTEYNECSYTARVMKPDRVITCNTKHIWKISIMRKQFIQKQVVRSDQHLRKYLQYRH